MTSTKKNMVAYSPLYFLNALGAGGLAVSFYMYLMWMTPHQGSPIPSFQTLSTALSDGSGLTQTIAVLGLFGVAVFSLIHLWLLTWNLQRFREWRKTDASQALRKANAETQLMTVPLTLAMTVNVAFILGAVFIPNVWETREVLFPFALIAFLVIGIHALRIYLAFLSRVLTDGGFDCGKNNSLGQMISIFAFSMVGVGFSSAAALSHNQATVSLGFLGAVFFVSTAIVLGIIKLVLGFRAMMEHKADAETTPTLWIIIPILTVLGIAIYRLKMGLMHTFDVKTAPAEITVFLITILSIQTLFGLIGWSVMKRVGYMARWVYGDEKSAGAYALICPGVALFVWGNFVINVGLVRTGLIDFMSWGYALLYLPLIYLQAITVSLFFRLNRKML